MSDQFYPSVPTAATPVTYAPPPSRLSVWRIAAAVFVGNFLCMLLGIVLYICFVVGIAALAGAGNR